MWICLTVGQLNENCWRKVLFFKFNRKSLTTFLNRYSINWLIDKGRKIVIFEDSRHISCFFEKNNMDLS